MVRDHLELKHVFELEERASQEENEVLRQDNLTMRNSIRRMCGETNKTVKGAKNEYEMNAEEFSRRFREQTTTHDVNMSLIRDQYNKVSAMHKRKVNNLTEKIEKDTTKLETQKEKRKLDLEGNMSDLSNLEKRMTFFQNYIGKLKSLVDRDQLLQKQLEAQTLSPNDKALNPFADNEPRYNVVDHEVIHEEVGEE